MKYLKIESGKGYFLDERREYQEIDKIKKEDILRFLDVLTSEGESLEMDSMETNHLENEAHKIIYENLWGKFNEVAEQKDRFVIESARLFKDAFEKYSAQ